MRSHFAHLVVYSGIIATFFSVLTRREPREQLRFGGLVWLGMAGGVLVLAYLMLPFPEVRRSFLTLWGPFLASLALVFWLSSLSEVPGAHYFWDKLLHTVGYAGLGVLALRAFHGGFERPRPAPTLFAAVAVILWGISDEFHQSFVPGRDASVWDLLADATGFAIAFLLLAIFTLRASRVRRPS